MVSLAQHLIHPIKCYSISSYIYDLEKYEFSDEDEMIHVLNNLE